MSLITLRGVSSALGTGTTSVTVSAPAGIAADDFLIAYIVDKATTGSSAAPTGWQRINGAAGTSGRLQYFTAIVGRNGLTGTSWSFTGLTTTSCGAIIGYIGVESLRTVDSNAVRANASGTTGCSQVTPTANQAQIVAAFAALVSGSPWSAEAVATNPTLTERFDQANGTSLSLAICDGNLTTRAGTGASSATMNTPGANAGALIALKPLVAGFQDYNTIYDENPVEGFSLTALSAFTYEDTEKYDWGYDTPIPDSQEEDGDFAYQGMVFSIEDPDWGFNTPAPSVKQGFDDDEFDSYPSMFPYWTDDDTTHATFFAREQYGDFEEQAPLQVSMIPESEDELFNFGLNIGFQGGGGTTSAGFKGFWSLRAGMGSEIDNWGFNPPVVTVQTSFDEDQFPLQPQVDFQDDDLFGFIPPVVAAGSGMMGYHGYWAFKGGMGSIFEDFGFNQPVVSVITAFQDDINPVAIGSTYVDDDLFSLDTQFAISQEDVPNSQVVVYSQYDDQGFIVLSDYSDTQGPNPVVVICIGSDEDKVDSTFFAREQFADAMEFGPSSSMITGYHMEPDTSFQVTFYADSVGDQEYAALIKYYDETDPFAYDTPVVQDLDNSKFFQFPTALIGTDEDKTDSPFFAREEFGEGQEIHIPQLSYWLSPNVDMDSSFALFFAREEFPDADEQSVYTQFLFTKDSDDHFDFDLPFVDQPQDERVITPPIFQWTDDDKTDSTFFAREQYSDDGSQDIIKQWSIIPYDTDFQFLIFPPGVLPNTSYDADYNPTMMQSFYFTEDESERENWGWMPPMIKLTEDEDQYMTVPQFIYPITDNDENWGFTPPVFAGSQNISAYHGYWALKGAMPPDVDWGFSPPVVTVINAFVPEEMIPMQDIRLFDDVDMFGMNPAIVGTGGTQMMGFRGYIIPKQGMSPEENFGFDRFYSFDEDELPPPTAFDFQQDDEIVRVIKFEDDVLGDIPSAPYFDYQEDEPFGFQTPVVVTTRFQDADEQFALPVARIFAEDDVFGFQPPIVVVPYAYDPYEQQPPPQIIVSHEDEVIRNIPFVDVIEPSLLSIYPFVTVYPQDNESVNQLIASVQDVDQTPLARSFVFQDTEDAFNINMAGIFVDDITQFPQMKFVVDVDEFLIFKIPPLVWPFDSEENPPFQREFYIPELNSEELEIEWVAPLFKPIIASLNVTPILDIATTSVMREASTGVLTTGVSANITTGTVKRRVTGTVTVTPKTKVQP